MMLGPVGEAISRKLDQSFSPSMLDVIDESALHAGHAGAHPEGESHFRIDIVSEAFSGKSRVDRHRMVNETLAALLKSRVHALAIKARAPEDGYTFAEIAADDVRLVALLRHHGLPSDDLGGESKRFFGLMTAKGELAAIGGIERCEDVAVLSSVAVPDGYRGKGLGRAMMRKLIADLRRDGVRAVYLLTQSAQGFFKGLGFAEIDRGEVPSAIAATSQFAGTRCASAKAMMMRIAEQR